MLPPFMQPSVRAMHPNPLGAGGEDVTALVIDAGSGMTKVHTNDRQIEIRWCLLLATVRLPLVASH